MPEAGIYQLDIRPIKPNDICSIRQLRLIGTEKYGPAINILALDLFQSTKQECRGKFGETRYSLSFCVGES